MMRCTLFLNEIGSNYCIECKETSNSDSDNDDDDDDDDDEY